MVVSNALRKLAAVLDEYEEERVTSVESTECLDANCGMTLTAEIELPVSTGPSNGDRTEVALSEATVDSDGTLQFTLESTAPVVSCPDGVTVEPGDVTLGDGPPTVAIVASVPMDDESSTGGESSGDGLPDEREAVADSSAGSIDARRDSDTPPFRDPELLAEVYESCDTFVEMTEELGMDVTAETVRRYMVDYDIHQPNSYETGDEQTDTRMADAKDDQQLPVVLPDGIGLPDDVTVDSFIETVKRSNTIYEVKQDIGIERSDALNMLQELNLLDLVVGRLATEAERDIKREEIVERLREASETQ